MKKRLAFMLGIWACVYPLVTLVLSALGWLDLQLPLALQTLLLTALVVPAMVFVIVPGMSRLVNGLASPHPDPPPKSARPGGSGRRGGADGPR